MFYINLHYAISIFVFMHLEIVLHKAAFNDLENFLCRTTYPDYYSFYEHKLYDNSYNPNNYYTGPIRIHYYYDQSFLNQTEHKFFIDEIMTMVDRKLKSIFYTRYGLKSGNLTLQPACVGDFSYDETSYLPKCHFKCAYTCLDVDIPFKYLKTCISNTSTDTPDGEGVPETDYIVVVNSGKYKELKCHNDFAASASCYLNEFDAPIGGALSICPKMITSQINPTVLRDLVLHQFFHMLGFNKYIFLKARDENGNAKCDRTNSYQPIQTCYYAFQIVRNRYNYLGKLFHTTKYIYNNLFIDILEKYFKCKTARLVFQDFTEPYHLDEILFGYEIMTQLPNPMLDKITMITLSFMSFMGWFNIQFDEVDPYDYLEFSNCKFYEWGIIEFAKSHKNTVKPPYCIKPFIAGKVFSCGSFIHFQYCDLVNTMQSNEHRQYFRELEGVKFPDAIKWSGSRSYIKSNPTYQTIYEFDIQSSFCQDVQSRDKKKNQNSIDSYYGNDSLCFNHNLDNPKKDDYYGAACHKVSELNSSAFEIYFKEQNYTCEYSKSLRIPVNESILIIDCDSYPIKDRFKNIRRKFSISQNKMSKITQNNFIIIILSALFYIYVFNNVFPSINKPTLI